MANENSPVEPEQKRGIWHRLHLQLRTTVFSVSFWLGLTLGFPFEHFLWEHVWPFKLISKWLGL